jgi:hypothetical protein
LPQYIPRYYDIQAWTLSDARKFFGREISIGMAGSEDDAYCWWTKGYLPFREGRPFQEACGLKLSHY